jgi:hypothetical protein
VLCKNDLLKLVPFVWQTFANGTRHVRADCASCKGFVRYLKQTATAPDYLHRPLPPDAHLEARKAPPAGWDWLGWIRQHDGVWRPVALARTLACCWDALLHYPGKGDLLCIPTRPRAQGGEDSPDLPNAEATGRPAPARGGPPR